MQEMAKIDAAIIDIEKGMDRLATVSTALETEVHTRNATVNAMPTATFTPTEASAIGSQGGIDSPP